MSWNYRILAHENNGEVYLQVHEVYYTNNIPDGYTSDPITVGSETLEGIEWTLNRMQEAVKKPVLWAGERFPNEYVKVIPTNKKGNKKVNKMT